MTVCAEGVEVARVLGESRECQDGESVSRGGTGEEGRLTGIGERWEVIH
jgi:hypothetical protein